ncbi:hypothetical protein MRB53_037552 [Persea americana]|nr:hypothetical protein MRB53_037552 [Persea americana]
MIFRNSEIESGRKRTIVGVLSVGVSDYPLQASQSQMLTIQAVATIASAVRTGYMAYALLGTYDVTWYMFEVWVAVSVEVNLGMKRNRARYDAASNSTDASTSASLVNRFKASIISLPAFAARLMHSNRSSGTAALDDLEADSSTTRAAKQNLKAHFDDSTPLSIVATTVISATYSPVSSTASLVDQECAARTSLAQSARGSMDQPITRPLSRVTTMSKSGPLRTEVWEEGEKPMDKRQARSQCLCIGGVAVENEHGDEKR